MANGSAQLELESMDLLISAGQNGRWVTTVLHSPAGETQTGAPLNLVLADLQANLHAVEQRTSTPAVLQALGGALFDALFSAEVSTLYRSSLSLVRKEGKGLRLVLRVEPPQVAALPWELLYDPAEERFLAISAETALVRFVPLGIPPRPLKVEPPLQILALLSNPKGVPPLDVAGERQIMEEALAASLAAGQISITFVTPATIPAITQAMRQNPPHVVHFVGHGIFEADQAYVVLEEENGDPHLMSAEDFRELFSGVEQVRLAVLNACQTATISSTQPLVGLAPRLLQRQLAGVLAMQYPFLDQAALIFSRTFYSTLALGYPVDAAISEARRQIFLEMGRGAIDWAIPVLFLRTPDGQLLDMAIPKSLPVEIDRQPWEPETLLISAGSFLMGRDAGEAVPESETPQHEVILPAYRMGRTPVTVGQYAEYVRRDRDAVIPRRAGWFLREPPADQLEHPVVGLSWHDAQAYCLWLSVQTGRTYRLPTEAEWEKAARGGDGRSYPWGDEANPEALAQDGAGTTPVGACPAGASPYGCLDMAGNVEEWTQSLWGSDPGRCEFPYPYRPDDGREDLDGEWLARSRRIVRSDSYRDEGSHHPITTRGSSNPETKVSWRGFRVVMDLAAEVKV